MMPTHARGLYRFALPLLLLPILCAAPARAAEKGQFKLWFSLTSNSADAKDFTLLRPNQTQDLYLFVKSTATADEEVTVEVLAGDKPIEGGTVTFVAAKGFTLVRLGKAAPAGEKPLAPPAPGAPPPPPPELAPLTGALKFTLRGKDKDGKPVDLEEVTNVAVAKPSKYVEISAKSYKLDVNADIKNRLEFKIKAGSNFPGGTKCRVELVLDPNRIPGLVEGPREGNWGGFLQNPGDVLTLRADNLKFDDTGAKPDASTNGLVYLTIDGYERAVIFNSSFPRKAGIEATLQEVPDTQTIVRLKAPVFGDNAKPFPVALELDNTPDKSVTEIGLDRSGEGTFSTKASEITVVGSGDRKQQILVNPAFPGHALQLKTIVADWNTVLDVADTFGKRLLRFRLLKSLTPAPGDEAGNLATFLDIAKDKRGANEILAEVIFDGAPAKLKFVGFPKQLERGAPLPVKALTPVPESGIKEVVFFLGKPSPDGKAPPDAVKVRGLRVDDKALDAKTGLFEARLDAPTDAKGKVDVTAQVTNGAGLVATETVQIELIPAKGAAGGAAPAGKASIEGKVVQGDRPQPNLPVLLRDAAGGVKDTTMTDDKGGFLFKEVLPGTYRVFASKTGDSTKGETIVQVQEGQKKTDVSVSIVR